MTRDVEAVRDAFDEIDLLDPPLPSHDLADTARGQVAGSRDERWVDAGQFEQPEYGGEVPLSARGDHLRIGEQT
ncbi:hypothetical protein ACIPLC_03915 [Kitasatospora sp. NPDC086801]|uniref:hypothetical protein n=1 Tax=Kitasatospora sp. NPDC086801 TaxID=3364066 RepID=UPI00380C7BC6